MQNVAIELGEHAGQDILYPPAHEINKFYELAQTGANYAIHSLRQFLGTGIDINLNCLSVLTLPVLIDRMNLFYQQHLGFHLRFSGEITGEIYTFFAPDDAEHLIEKMLGSRRFKYSKNFNHLEISALSELVNILTNSFWRVLTDKTAINWFISPPTLMGNLSRSLFYSSKIHTIDYFLIHLEYILPLLGVRIQFILLPTRQTLQKIFSRLTTEPPQVTLIPKVSHLND